MDLTTLRPTNTTAAAIGESLQRAQAAQAEAAQGEKDAKQRRDSLLLDGSPAQLGAADKVLAAARDLAARVAAMTTQLQERLAVAERAEALASVEAARSATEAARTAVSAWWGTHETQLRATIQEGLRLSAAASEASHDHAWGQRRTAQRFPEAEALPQPTGYADDADLWKNRLKVLLDV